MINAKMNSSMFGSSQINFLNYMGSRRYDSRSRQPFEDILMPQTTTKPMVSTFFNKLFILNLNKKSNFDIINLGSGVRDFMRGRDDKRDLCGSAPDMG